MDRLLPLIRFPLINVVYLQDCVRAPPLVLHAKHWIIRNTKEFAFKALHDTEY